ncbi:hypothetical protein CBR_g51991 [Chara braunii]|uniref:Uncharacterized protein n=1 Tax=Chara braunii TaxID=69332 RepID=A0A388K6M9_CHABU|nr:hypothetical protein CBR_g51991 [Chara braunii]|eukprot:GBG65691.1 hypothetical protein CBR_g51991 [Chara braunii]
MCENLRDTQAGAIVKARREEVMSKQQESKGLTRVIKIRMWTFNRREEFGRGEHRPYLCVISNLLRSSSIVVTIFCMHGSSRGEGGEEEKKEEEEKEQEEEEEKEQEQEKEKEEEKEKEKEEEKEQEEEEEEEEEEGIA